MMEWQDILTYPLDGSVVLVCDTEGEIFIGWRHDPAQMEAEMCLDIWYTEGSFHGETFTHWMPLPLPPKR